MLRYKSLVEIFVLTGFTKHVHRVYGLYSPPGTVKFGVAMYARVALIGTAKGELEQIGWISAAERDTTIHQCLQRSTSFPCQLLGCFY